MTDKCLTSPHLDLNFVGCLPPTLFKIGGESSMSDIERLDALASMLASNLTEWSQRLRRESER